MAKFSLMTFSMVQDLSRKTMTIKDALQIAANLGAKIFMIVPFYFTEKSQSRYCKGGFAAL